MSPTISLHGHSAVHTSAGNAYDFGYDNPQFSDKILHILPERVCKTELHANAALQSSGPLLSMHINSLTLAANSDVFRFVLNSKRHPVDVLLLLSASKLTMCHLPAKLAFLGHAEQRARLYFTLEVN